MSLQNFIDLGVWRNRIDIHPLNTTGQQASLGLAVRQIFKVGAFFFG